MRKATGPSTMSADRHDKCPHSPYIQKFREPTIIFAILYIKNYFPDLCRLIQPMLGDTGDRTCECPHTCRIPSTSRKLPVPALLSTVQSHMPNRNFSVATATLVTVTFAVITLVCHVFSYTGHLGCSSNKLVCISYTQSCVTRAIPKARADKGGRAMD